MKFTIFSLFIWLFILGCSSTKKNEEQHPPQTNTPTEVDLFETISYDDRIEVNLIADTEPKALVSEFAEYDLEVIRQVSRSQPIFHCSFNTEKIDLEKIMQQVALSELVNSVKTVSYTTKKKK